MIYIVERPHQRKSSAWFALDKTDFIRRVAAANERRGDTVFEAQTIRQIADLYGFDPESQADLVEYKFADLASMYGIDANLYRGYCETSWSIEPIDEFEQYALACAHDLYGCHIYQSETEAVEALRAGELDSGHNTTEGRGSLLKLLVKYGQLDALVAAGLKPLLIAERLLDAE